MRWIFVVAMFCATALVNQTAKASTPSPTDARQSSLDAHSTGVAAVTGRLLAPCCWTQTLDVHESELASELRGEIRERLQKGESGAIIEDDLAARFGERIRAVPRHRDPRMAVPVLVGIAMLVSAFGLVLLLKKWRRSATREQHAPAVATVEIDEYEERLNEELARFDLRY